MCPCRRRRKRHFTLLALGALLVYGCGGGGGSGDQAPPPPPPPVDVSLSLSEEVIEINEWDRDAPVELMVSLSEVASDEVVVALNSTGTALLGGDFDLSETEVRVPQGATSATTMITPIRDFEEEGEEMISIEIGTITGNGQSGEPNSVSLSLLDQGALFEGVKENIYGKLYAFFSDPHIHADRIDFVLSVFNFGAAATSPTNAIFWISQNKNLNGSLFAQQFQVPSLDSGYSVRLGTTVPLRRLPGAGTYYGIISVTSPEEEAPGSRRPQDFSGVVIEPSGRVRLRCPDFDRNTSPGIEDPLREAQWNLENTGQTAYASLGGSEGEDMGMTATLADGPTGAGVKVAVVDTGLEICHPDLEPNVEAGASFNFNEDVWLGTLATDPFFPGTYGDHGTSVAGLIAAQADNGVGLRGVAPSASLRGYNFLSTVNPSAYFDSHGGSDSRPNSTDVDIFNMSFGVFGGEYNVSQAELDLFRQGVLNLRSGRGAIYVKAGGNSFGRCVSLERIDEVEVGEVDPDGDGVFEPLVEIYDINEEIGCVSANADASQNLPYLIAVGAFGADGQRSSYSSAGSALWVSAPAGEFGVDFPAQISTDQMGAEQGYDALLSGLTGSMGIPVGSSENPLGDYINSFNGTSAAAPNASGAIALLLEVQPEFTWRDVKYILARSARQIHADIGQVKIGFGGSGAVLRHGWVTNAAGYQFHNWYGFGAIAIDDAVELARTHVPGSLGVFSDGEEVFERSDLVDIPDHNGAGVSQTLNVTGIDDALKVEAVQLDIQVTHPFTNDLGLYLISPSGTESILNAPFHEILTANEDLDWILLSNAFYGESPSGEWTLKVVDVAEGDVGTLESWSLTFYLGEVPPRS